MKIALAQMEVVPGKMEQNVGKMLTMISRARSESVDLIVFPELCVSGYILSDRWVDDAFCRELMRYNTILQQASDGIALAYGNIFLDSEINARWNDVAWHPNKDGRSRKYNAVYVFQNGQPAPRLKESRLLPAGVQPKTLLPEYRIFDDERYFFSLEDVVKDAGVPLQEAAQPFLLNVDGLTISVGCEICEDLWCNDYRLSGKPLNITNILIDNGAEIIINISASPWNYGKNAARDKRVEFLREQAAEKFVPFLYVSNTGAQNNGKNIITFDGGTTVYNRDGKPVLMAEQSYQEELLIFDDTIFNRTPQTRTPEPRIKSKFAAIMTGIKHMANLNPEPTSPRFVIGLSGGIDSAVVASLLTLAWGKENVIAINMPSVYNVSQTRESAKVIAGKLGIELLHIPIDPFVAAHEVFRTLDKKFAPTPTAQELSDENIQAKIRGTSILSNFAGRYNRLFPCNGNKLEIALGYSTLYGDVNGALAPIGDLTKTEVYELAKFLNVEIFRDDVIPSNLFPDEFFSFDGKWIVPSAELKSNQVDPIRFGYHCALLAALTDFVRKSPEDILEWYLDGRLHDNLGIDKALLVRWGITDPQLFVSDLEWFVSTIEKNIFKRIQAPPIIITSRSAYGYDIRESMLPFVRSARYEELKARVLKMAAYQL